MSLYSERFVRTYTQGTTTYTVPSGNRAVIMSWTVTNLGAAAGKAYLTVFGVIAIVADVPAQASRLYTDLRLVAYGGNAVEVTLGATDLSSVCCGYLFSDTSWRSSEHERIEALPEETPHLQGNVA